MKFYSNLEKKLYAEMKSCTYHPAERLSYIIPKMYEPDFCYNNAGWMSTPDGWNTTNKQAGGSHGPAWTR